MSKKIFIAIPVLLLAGILSSFIFPGFFPVSADDSANTTFQVNIKESLSVSITTPTSWANGDVDTFLRNTVGLKVASNNANGFTASMSAQNSTALAHSSKAGVVLNTLDSSSSRASFPANYWGYSLESSVTGDNKTYGETNSGNPNSTYYPITTSATPITILKNTTSGTLSQNIYFGAKSDITKASGTYSGTVVINVVSGIINNDNSDPSTYNPITPTNPATDVTPGTPVEDTTNHRLISTTRTVGNDTTTTETTVTDTYVAPQGVTDSTSSNIYDGSMLTTALAATASVAAASGVAFFILAKRKKDDDEEETT